MPDLYKIIGGDRKEYGPVTAEEVGRWLTEGRLNAQSQVRLEGTQEWKPLSAFTDLARALGLETTPPPLPQTPGPVARQVWVADMLGRQPDVQAGRCLARAWGLWRDNFGLFCAASFLVWAVSLLEFVPVVGLVYRVFAGVLYGGVFLVVVKRIRGQPATVADTLGGFSEGFGQLVLAGFISWLLSQLGFIFCILPGIYLTVAWCLSVPLVADRGLEFWTAMELSRKVVSRVWVQVFGVMFVAFLPVVLATGLAAARGGLLLLDAIHKLGAGGPPSAAALMDMATQLEARLFPMAILVKVVMLLNLPFVVAVLMLVYEDLFGARPAPAA